MGGVVYHSNYLNYFERGRSEWAEQAGLGIEWQKEQGIYFLVRYAKLDYLKPARLHEIVEVVSNIKEVRLASIIYDQHLRLQASPDTILCKGEIKVVCIGNDFKPCELPQKMTNFIGEPL